MTECILYGRVYFLQTNAEQELAKARETGIFFSVSNQVTLTISTKGKTHIEFTHIQLCNSSTGRKHTMMKNWTETQTLR